jgi:magnesium-transporting ATPase (P-type)
MSSVLLLTVQIFLRFEVLTVWNSLYSLHIYFYLGMSVMVIVSNTLVYVFVSNKSFVKNRPAVGAKKALTHDILVHSIC